MNNVCFFRLALTFLAAAFLLGTDAAFAQRSNADKGGSRSKSDNVRPAAPAPVRSAPATVPKSTTRAERPAPTTRPERPAPPIARTEVPPAERFKPALPGQSTRPERPVPTTRPERPPVADRPTPTTRPERPPVVDRPTPTTRPERPPIADRPTPTTRPERPPVADRPTPTTRPERPPVADRPTPTTRPERPARPPIADRPGDRPPKPGPPKGERPNRPAPPPGMRPGYRPPPPNVVADARRYHRDYDRYWTPDWYRHHSHIWYSPHIPASRWWYRPTWDSTWGWFGSGFFVGVAANRVLNPYPYYYGNNIIYRNDMVYVNGVPYVSAAEYYRQAAELANSAPVIIERTVIREQPVAAAAEPNKAGEVPVLAPPEPEPKLSEPLDGEYLPMGSFALLDDDGKEKSGVLVQLATDKKGQIRGNYVDEKTGTVRQLAGAVDSKSQRVALRFTDGDKDDKTVLECGLWNLTQDTVPLLIHRSEKETQQRTLIRIVKEGESEDAPQESSEEEYHAP